MEDQPSPGVLRDPDPEAQGNRLLHQNPSRDGNWSSVLALHAMKRCPIRKVSKKRAKELRIYAPLRGRFLQEHPFCQVVGCAPMCASEVHHRDGRNGQRLLNVDKFVAVCREHHAWIHSHPKEARKLGLLT